MKLIPLHLDGRSMRELLKSVYRDARDDDLITYAASLAFHSILALFPFLLFLLAVVTFIDAPAVFQRLIDWAHTMLPPEGVRQIVEVVDHFRESRNASLLSLGVVGAVWGASGGVRSAIHALNRIYDVAEPRSTWRRYLLSLGFTVALGAILIIALGMMLLGPRVVAWLVTGIGGENEVVTIWNWLRFPFAAALLMVFTAAAYSVLPNVKGFRLFTAGSLCAVLLWIALSLLFKVYLLFFGRYNVLYGSLGAVIILLLYLWFSCIVLLLGAELNVVLARAKRTGA